MLSLVRFIAVSYIFIYVRGDLDRKVLGAGSRRWWWTIVAEGCDTVEVVANDTLDPSITWTDPGIDSRFFIIWFFTVHTIWDQTDLNINECAIALVFSFDKGTTRVSSARIFFLSSLTLQYTSLVVIGGLLEIECLFKLTNFMAAYAKQCFCVIIILASTSSRIAFRGSCDPACDIKVF